MQEININKKSYIQKITPLQAVIFYFAINLLASGVGLVEVGNFYESLSKPFFAPPAWVFGPVWITNTALVSYACYIAINSQASDARKKFLQWQFASWIIYLTFQYLSFGTQILFLFFLPTFAMLITTIVSIYYAYLLDLQLGGFWQRAKKFKNISLCFITLLPWLLLATALSLSLIWLN